MIALLLTLGLALAASWAPPVPLEQALGPDGRLELPAGDALRLVITPAGALPELRDEDGAVVALRGERDGVLVPQAGQRRSLAVRLPEGAEAEVRWQDHRGDVARWAAAADADPPAPGALPWGSPALADRLAVAAAAVHNPAVRALGRAGELALLQPLSSATHDALPAQAFFVDEAEPAQLTVRGPGVLVLRSLPREAAAFTRYTVATSLDGQPLAEERLGSTGQAPLSFRVALPPGAHALTVASRGAGIVAVVEVWRLRPRLFGPAPRDPGPLTGLDEAERRWWMGDRAGATARFQALLDEASAPAATRALAALRLAAVAPDGEALAALLRTAGLDETARRALASAALARAADAGAAALPPEAAEAALDHAAGTELEALAAWLDRLGGLRPRGLALLSAADTAVVEGTSPGALALREAGAATRFSARWPDLPGLADAAADPEAARALVDLLGQRQLSERGAGAARALASAGSSLDLRLPARAAGRLPVLRLETRDPSVETVYRLDDQRYTWTGAGPLDVALPPGPHRLEVEQGALLLLDPEVVADETAPLLRAWTSFPLPMSWSLPDAGYGVDLRVRVPAAAEQPPLTARFDDGTELLLQPDAEGFASLAAGTWATSLRLAGGPGATASLELRTGAGGVALPPLEPLADLDAALAALDRETRALDAAVQAGDRLAQAQVRLARARLLGALGQLRLARRDLDAVLALAREEPAALAEPAAAAWALAEAVVPELPSALVAGPQSPEAALAAAGLRAALPEGDPAAQAKILESLAEQSARASSDPALSAPLWRAAAERYEEADAPIAALAAVSRAGPEAAPLAERLAGRLRFQPLTRAEASAGLVPVTVRPTPLAPDAPAGQRVRAALLAPPWPETEGVTLRGESADVAKFSGSQVQIALFCRDEQGRGDPCQSALRLGAQTEALTVPDGGALRLDRAVASPVELEVAGPGDGHALLVRLEVDGALLEPETARLALRASPGRPVRLTVAGGRALQVRAVRGQAEVAASGPRALAASLTEGEEVLLALPEDGPWVVQIRGDADLLLSEGTPRPETPAPPAAPPAPLASPPPRLPDARLAPLFNALSTPPPAALPEAGRAGSLLLSASLARQALTQPVEPWTRAELAAAWLKGEAATWTELGAWVHGLTPAGGIQATRGWRLPEGALALDGAAAASGGVAGSAGRLEGVARGWWDLGHARPQGEARLWVRLDARARATLSSPEPIGRVDPAAWTRFALDHPLSAKISASVLSTPTRDLRATAGVSATTNTLPWPAPLDRVGAFATLSALLDSSSVLRLDVTSTWRFADADRARPGDWVSLGLRVDRAFWLREQRRLRLVADARLLPVSPAWQTVGATAGLRAELLLSRHRGLRDLPPDAEPFVTLRESP